MHMTVTTTGRCGSNPLSFSITATHELHMSPPGLGRRPPVATASLSTDENANENANLTAPALLLTADGNPRQPSAAAPSGYACRSAPSRCPHAPATFAGC